MAESSKTTASDQSPCENRSMNSSAVWQHFKKVEGSDGKIKSVCDFCRKSYSLSSSTTNLKKHLITAHSKDIKIAKLAKKATVVKKKISNTSIANSPSATESSNPSSTASSEGEKKDSPKDSQKYPLFEKMRDDYLEWTDYFMANAFLAAKRSKDPRSQVGACIVNDENQIVAIGYNGMPNGCKDNEFPWYDPRKHEYVVHAAVNAILNKTSPDVKDCTMYCTRFPCNECAKAIIQSGINLVKYASNKHHHQTDDPSTIAARMMLSRAGVSIEQCRPEMRKLEIDFESND